MYYGIQRIEYVIDKIEENIRESIDLAPLAAEMGLSLYEFRRIFAFIVGCPISEYIRKRRLSLAACELMTNKRASIQSISERYGYATEAAFSKAFRDQHGTSPSGCRDGECEIELFKRPRFELSVSGGEAVSMSVISDTGYGIRGLEMTSPYTDTACCDAVWRAFYEQGEDEHITGEHIYAAYRNEDDEVLCTVGERVECGDIPATSWACFKMKTTDDEIVNRKYGEIIYEILPSANLSRNEALPTVEVFPRDMSEDGFEWEIRIPIINNNI